MSWEEKKTEIVRVSSLCFVRKIHLFACLLGFGGKKEPKSNDREEDEEEEDGVKVL